MRGKGSPALCLRLLPSMRALKARPLHAQGLSALCHVLKALPLLYVSLVSPDTSNI
jgi:hypothetical protein